LAGRAHDGGRAVLVNAEKTVRMSRRAHRIDRHLQAASVLFLRPTGMERPLAISRCVCDSVGAGANRRPGDEVGDVLRHNRVEKFRRRRQTQADDFKQQFSRNLQAGFDVLRNRRGAGR